MSPNDGVFDSRPFFYLNTWPDNRVNYASVWLYYAAVADYRCAVDERRGSNIGSVVACYLEMVDPPRKEIVVGREITRRAAYVSPVVVFEIVCEKGLAPFQNCRKKVVLK